jgi:hypothetical protein
MIGDESNQKGKIDGGRGPQTISNEHVRLEM